jgi:hypothetical protein
MVAGSRLLAKERFTHQHQRLLYLSFKTQLLFSTEMNIFLRKQQSIKGHPGI